MQFWDTKGAQYKYVHSEKISDFILVIQYYFV